MSEIKINTVNNNSIPETPKPPQKSNKILLVVLGLGLVVVLAVFLNKNQKRVEPVKTVEEKAGEEKKVEYVPTLSDTQIMLDKTAKLKFSEIQNSQNVDLGDLSDELKILVLNGAENITVKKLQLQGGKQGFEIEYLQNEAMQEAYKKLMNTVSKWKFLSGSRALLASMVETESLEYSIKINLSVQSENITLVKISAVKK